MLWKQTRMAVVCAMLGTGVTGISSCLNRPVTTTDPQTSNIFVDLTSQRSIDKIDLLFMVDNSISMSDKQAMLKLAVPQLLGRLINPMCKNGAGESAAPANGVCPAGFEPEFDPIDDIHIGVISSSLGSPSPEPKPGDPKTGVCEGESVRHGDDAAHLIGLRRTRPDGSALETYQGLGFLAWDPKGKKLAQGLPVGESDPTRLIQQFQELVVATGETGCGYEASLEAWYRFLIDPAPPARWVVENDRARPDGVDMELLEQRRQFLRPDSLVAVVMLSDENDCSLDFRGEGWKFASGGELISGEPRNLRCFEQQRRFGATGLYPVSRYIDALKLPTVLAHDGTEHQNPLFTNLNTGGVASRTPDLVFLAGIVGVPWQDIATEDSLGTSAENVLRYQDAQSLLDNDVWPLILGEGAQGAGDPLMRESPEPRQGLAPPESAPMANAVNGHEYYTGDFGDLQYACIFPLQTPDPCVAGENCECDKSVESMSPLCQQASGEYTDTQLYAKAYPGLRHLEVLKGAGASGIVASICPKLLPPADSTGTPDPNVGYNPAVDAILQVIGTKLGGKCVPRQLAPDRDTGRVPCAMVEVLPADSQGQCAPCSGVVGRIEAEAAIAKSVRGQLRSLGSCSEPSCPGLCLCEIEQSLGADLDACQNQTDASAPGYCYIDAALELGNPALVQDCPGQRGLRFVGEETPRNGAQTFIACVGAPFGDVVNGQDG